MKKTLLFVSVLFAAVSVSAQSSFKASDFIVNDETKTINANISTSDNTITFYAKSDKTGKIDANTAYFNETPSTATQATSTSYTARLQTSGNGADDYRCFIVSAQSAGKLKIAARTGSNSATDRNIIVKQGSKTLKDQMLLESNAVTATDGKVYPYIVVDVTESGNIWIGSGNGNINIYAVEWIPAGVSSVSNPIADVVYFNGTEIVNENGLSLQVYNTVGSLVRTSNSNITMTDLQSGVYIVRAEGVKGALKISK
ncbi:hypothetical protein D0T49_04975 [Paludibacter sp. 221]|uniref:hypothetical protein n=1 Tax=Paludibacter sp. 221 TaxID=2302939 RepID=UPI0013D5B8F1|nr:hypothetical protein [Paludibacter sp. 221]NDV46392.1 hypothetical protein [Paludibacter sp. 221]